MGTDHDHIEKKILLRASRDRVWRASTDSAEFGAWFGVKLDGPFVAGRSIRGVTQPTAVDPAFAAKQQAYAGMKWDATVDRIEPQRIFSLRWHPFAVDRNVDYSNEPSTLIAFELEEFEGGTMLTITESGFDGIPVARRAKAFDADSEGWAIVTGLIEKYVRAAA
jgi:uncharacterized protein YndB with AHSA1/START domain